MVVERGWGPLAFFPRQAPVTPSLHRLSLMLSVISLSPCPTVRARTEPGVVGPSWGRQEFRSCFSAIHYSEVVECQSMGAFLQRPPSKGHQQYLAGSFPV